MGILEAFNVVTENHAYIFLFCKLGYGWKNPRAGRDSENIDQFLKLDGDLRRTKKKKICFVFFNISLNLFENVVSQVF